MASPYQLRMAALNEVMSFDSAAYATKAKTGELGFEPRQADPESAVLPLHHSPNNLTISQPGTEKGGEVAGEALAVRVIQPAKAHADFVLGGTMAGHLAQPDDFAGRMQG